LTIPYPGKRSYSDQSLFSALYENVLEGGKENYEFKCHDSWFLILYLGDLLVLFNSSFEPPGQLTLVWLFV
jgi:hypothetical protein